MKFVPKSINLKISLISMGIMLLIVLLGDLQIGLVLYLHHLPELVAFNFLGSWLKESKMKFYPLLVLFISFGIVYWSIFHIGYLVTLLFLYLLMFPLFIGYFVPILIIEKKMKKNE